MTAGMNSRNLEAGRISLPRAGLGALLAGTLLAGTLLGAAAYATVSMINANAAPVTSGTVAAGTSAGVIRQGQLATGNGPLVGDERGLPSGTTGVRGVTRTTGFPAGRDGFGYDQPVAPASKIVIQHAPGRGPLQ
jgi:hypothetical protein